MSRSSFRVRVIPRVPTNIEGTNGVKAQLDIGTYSYVISPDYPSLVIAPATSNLPTTFIRVYDFSTGMYTRVSLSNLADNIQAGVLGPNLASIKALTTAADKVPYFIDNAGNAATYTVSSYVRGVSNAADKPSYLAAIGAATTDQGGKADTALQPGQAATPAQGAKADTALQPGQAATPAQGVKADNSVQYIAKPGDTDVQIQGYVNSVASPGRVVVRFPAGSYTLNANVSPNGRQVTYEIDPQSSFSGPGILQAQATNTYFNFPTDILQELRTVGTYDNPTGSWGPVAYFGKTGGPLTSNLNPTVVVTGHRLQQNGQGNAVSAFFVEALESIGNPTGGTFGFTEGARIGTYVRNNATHALGYGAILSAGSEPGSQVDILMAVECDVANRDADAPSLSAYAPGSSKLVSAINLTSGGTKRPLAYATTNPSDWVPEAARPRGAYVALGPVNEAVFAYVDQLGTPVGLDLRYGKCTFSAIALANNQRISIRSMDGVTDRTALWLTTSDLLVLGQGLANIGHDGNFGPLAGNTFSIGTAGARYKDCYLNNNPNVSSDARIKKVRGELTDAEISAAESIRVQAFQYLSAIDAKGEAAARVHFGVIAQEVQKAFQDNGLDPWRYGVLGADPVMVEVTKTRTSQRQVMEDDEETVEELVKEGDTFVSRAVTRPVKRPKETAIPIVDADGNQIFESVPERDENGKYVLEVVEIDDPNTGEKRGVERIRKSVRQRMKYIPVMEDFEESYTVMEDSGEKRLSIRYEQLAMFMIAALRAS